ncbi:helix-turn-helix domain-containing protein [Aquabacterium sp. A7-Y]|uniref:helix-turn-helix domain-containing protein n=1 Tax=Aquabacterium sp. A7-Y TaxID=1349605 RepID=UPI00223DD879|nr:helix-turn-helix domain-containing protein [Aquabacterium sp. A7-Y]MCW7538420.1 helix-turn-helix domain-containing protein [Aquabacterium sp. A7-Y]
MTRESTEQLPLEVLQTVQELGRRIRTARVRRRMTTDDLADACGIGRRTLYRIENGEPGVALGTYLAVLWKLGLLDSAKKVADPDADEHGKILEAASRPQRVRPRAPDNDF